MMTLIAAAIAAAAPAASPAGAPSDHQQQMAQKGEECCCKEMMEKMHSGHDMGRMQDHQEHSGK